MKNLVLEKKIASSLSASSYFLLIFMVSICSEKVWNISLFKSSNMFPILFLMKVVEGEELTKVWLAIPFFLVALGDSWT